MDKEFRGELAAVHDWACDQIARTAGRLEGSEQFPHVTDDGRWRTWPADVYAGWDGDSWSHGNWTCGFWVGLLWLALSRTHDHRFEEWARYFGDLVAPRQRDENTHDIGFIFYPSFALGHSVTGDEKLREPAVRAARTLTTRFNPRGGYLQAWGPLDHPLARRSTAIDTMMNLPLLWWASRITNDPEFAEIARAHAVTSARYYLRPDGSTYHIYTFDPDTGTGMKGGTYQGANPDSTWSRGVTWGIYGWTLAYREHRDPAFLEAAEKAADYFVGALPADLVPPWDFADDDPSAPKDSSATAICANAFLELGEVHPDALRRAYYRSMAEAMLASLCRDYLGRDEEGEEGILLHSAYSVPHDDGVDSSVMWGEWFFLRAVSHLTVDPVPIP
jgi:unsaturated chondroitin disaccharide hydrolase